MFRNSGGSDRVFVLFGYKKAGALVGLEDMSRETKIGWWGTTGVADGNIAIKLNTPWKLIYLVPRLEIYEGKRIPQSSRPIACFFTYLQS